MGHGARGKKGGREIHPRVPSTPIALSSRAQASAAELRALSVVPTAAILVELAEALAWGRVDHATQVALEGATAIEEGEERVDVRAAADAPNRARVSVVHNGHGTLKQRHVGQPGVEISEMGEFGLG